MVRPAAGEVVLRLLAASVGKLNDDALQRIVDAVIALLRPGSP